MSKTTIYRTLMLLSTLTLIACGKQEQVQSTASSSETSSMTISHSSTESSASSSSAVSLAPNGRFDLDVTRLARYGYTAPSDVIKYAGTYSGVVTGVFRNDASNESGTEDRSKVDIVINEDGSYRLLIKTYPTKTDKYGGYFDATGNFTRKDFSKIDLAGQSVIDNPYLDYEQGVLVEAFGEVYLLPLWRLYGLGAVHNNSFIYLGSYLTEAGEFDDSAALVRNVYYQTGSQELYDVGPLPSFEELEGVGENGYRNYEVYGDEIKNFEPQGALLSIKDGQLTSKDGGVFTQTTAVNPVIQKPLSDLMTEEAIAELFSTPNNLIQYFFGTSFSAKFSSENKIPEKLDPTEVYSKKTGQPVADGVGYKYGEYFKIIIDDVIYGGNTSETDGKMIIKDNDN